MLCYRAISFCSVIAYRYLNCCTRMGLIVPKTKDGRVLFFLPWEGSTICGTTDSKSNLTMYPTPAEKDIQFILDESNRYVSREPVL